MATRQRKAHNKSRNGCVECKRRHQRCDEIHPQRNNCMRLSTKCSFGSDGRETATFLEERPLAISDLRLLHHWHMASNSSDFLKFVDHAHVDDNAEYDRMITLAFNHPYLLHTILALSALHMLHSDPDNLDLYVQSSAHNSSALKLARPQIRRLNLEHINALCCFAGLASLYGTAEPPLRLGVSKLEDPADCLRALLNAFEMSRGIRTVMKNHRQHIEESGFLDPERWKDDRHDVLPTLEANYPQLRSLQTLISEGCEVIQRGPCRDAVYLLFTYIAVLERKPINHSTISLIQRWPMDIDQIVLQMAAEHSPVALIVLAHYAVLMHMRRNYWFFARWPTLLLHSVKQILPSTMHCHLQWAHTIIIS